MAYCRNCGKEIDNNASFCPDCGASQNTAAASAQNQTPAPAAVSDEGGILWGLLGCCIPIVGLILYLIWKNERPRTAKSAGLGALISVGISVLYYIVVLLIGIGFGIFG